MTTSPYSTSLKSLHRGFFAVFSCILLTSALLKAEVVQATINPAVEVHFNALSGVTYEIHGSTDLENWAAVETGILGQGTWVSRTYSTVDQSKRFFQVFDVPSGLAAIPAGSFTMGDALDGNLSAPTHMVSVSAFYMAKNVVTWAEWQTVKTWAATNGYTDLATGAGKAGTHPVQTISWWDAVKYCNARSQKEGLTPVYTVSGLVMKTGTTAPTVNWAANGYRLPTEAEWEKAARGGLSGKRFPWGDTISQSQANYYAYNGYSYDLSGAVNNYHPTYATGSTPYTSPVGSFAANGYGLNDMAGNVWQWCRDWYGTYDTGSQTDPRGVSSGSYRVFRGGSWYSGNAGYSSVAFRGIGNLSSTDYSLGFRVARSLAP